MVTKQRISLDEFLAMPEEDASLEYVDGEVIEKGSPKFKHGRIQKRILWFLEGSAAAKEFEAVPEVHFFFGEPTRGYVPDVSIVRRENLQRDEDGEVADDQWFAPEVAIEIHSPGQNAGRLIEKLAFYRTNGVRVVLVVDNQLHQVTVYREGEEPRTLTAPDTIDLAPVVPAELNVAELFAALRE